MKRMMTAALACSLLLTGCCTPVKQEATPEPISSAEVSQEEKTPAEETLPESSEPDTIPEPEPEPEPLPPFQYTLCFAGDVSLLDGGSTVSALNEHGLEWCLGETLLERMRNADVMCLNSEFSFTERGEPIEGKSFTFRSKPSRISVLQDMGVDVAVLANNHVFDYGEVGLLDTLDTFQDAGLPYVGAGRDLDEASAVWYAQLEDCTVAYIAGSRVEWSMLTRGAGEGLPGVFRTAESNDLILQRIREAREKADFVVVYEHWGQEGTTDLEEYQTQSGRAFLDAGADVVVGDHPHVVQGIEWYNGKPILYSMGNYWFTSSKERYTMLLEMEVQRDEEEQLSATYRLVPAWASNTKVRYLSDEDDRAEFYRYMKSISVNGSIGEDGTLLPPEESN